MFASPKSHPSHPHLPRAPLRCVSAPAQVFFWEFFSTFVLVSVVFATAVDDSAAAHFVSIAPLAIGLSLFACAQACGPFTGGCLNPARFLGPAMVFGCGWPSAHAYLLGQMCGGALAGFLFKLRVKLQEARAEGLERKEAHLPLARSRALLLSLQMDSAPGSAAVSTVLAPRLCVLTHLRAPSVQLYIEAAKSSNHQPLREEGGSSIRLDQARTGHSRTAPPRAMGPAPPLRLSSVVEVFQGMTTPVARRPVGSCAAPVCLRLSVLCCAASSLPRRRWK